MKLNDNEDRMLRPFKLHKDPEEHCEPVKDPEHNGNAAWAEFLETNPGEVRRAFNHFEPAAQVAKALIAQNFETKDYESRRPMLRKYASEEHAPTIADRVRCLR